MSDEKTMGQVIQIGSHPRSSWRDGARDDRSAGNLALQGEEETRCCSTLSLDHFKTLHRRLQMIFTYRYRFKDATAGKYLDRLSRAVRAEEASL